MTRVVSIPRKGEVALPDQMPGAEKKAVHPPTRIGRLVLILTLLIAGFWGGLGSWAALASIQSAVIAMGSFKVKGDLPEVQHLEGGLVREIRVQEGDHVDRDQVLVVLADTVSQAQDRILYNQLVSLLAQEARLEAEYRRLDEMVLSDELKSLMDRGPAFAEIVQTQEELFVSNGEMWHGQAAILRERVEEQEEQLAGLASRRASLAQRLEIVQDELKDLKTLFDRGLITKTRYTSRREAEVAILGEVNYLASQIDSVRQRVAETEERVLQVRRDRIKQISDERQAVKQQIFELRQRIVANDDIKERRLVRAPQAGKIIDLQFTSPGEVIEDGETVLKIVPDDAEFIAEGRVRPEDVDQVAEGHVARVRLTAYNFRTTPAVEGVVTHVSADSFTDEDTGKQYFKVNIRIPDEELAVLPDVEVLPGMPAQIMIATGEQTVANYLLSPVVAGLETALREGD
ncbi:HlyD family type I secretion periplasmic adaptor subunit [Rhodobacteraceae bacterium F11138]|nr:HlyD family type I secretion periplasmic adaptor subunit [Rhodobacteraceae bacterium F11138]